MSGHLVLTTDERAIYAAAYATAYHYQQLTQPIEPGTPTPRAVLIARSAARHARSAVTDFRSLYSLAGENEDLALLLPRPSPPYLVPSATAAENATDSAPYFPHRAEFVNREFELELREALKRTRACTDDSEVEELVNALTRFRQAPGLRSDADLIEIDKLVQGILDRLQQLVPDDNEDDALTHHRRAVSIWFGVQKWAASRRWP